MKKERILISKNSRSTTYATSYNSDITDQFMYVQHLGLTFCSPDYIVKNRCIDSNLICIVFKGQGTLIYDDHSYPLSKDTGFILNCSRIHSYYPDPSNPMALLFLHYHGPMTSVHTNRIIHQQGSPILFPSMIHFSKRSIGAMYKEFHNTESEDIFELMLSINEILVRLLQISSTTIDSKVNMPSQIQSAAKYIEAFFTSPITAQSVADRIPMSKYHFTRTFKKHMGQTPYEYILFCRLNHARYLLLNSEMTISEIADLLVFNSTSHFVEFFKKRSDVTPLQYRKEHTTKS